MVGIREQHREINAQCGMNMEVGGNWERGSVFNQVHATESPQVLEASEKCFSLTTRV